MLRHLSLTLILGIVLTACTPATTPAPATEKLKVVATYSIVGDMVQNVAGDAIELRVLVGPDSDAHTFEPTPQDSVALQEAKLIVENGLEFESWLDELYNSSGSQAVRAALSDGLEPLEGEHHEGEEGHEEGEAKGTEEAHSEEEHGHGEFDPHIWHSTANAAVMVKNIQNALSTVDPANAATYQANAEKYLAEIAALEAFIKEQANSLPAERRKLVTSHDTFGYFARDYGFEIVGTALGSISTESGDPAADQLAKLVNEIKAAGVPSIFAENVANEKLMSQIATEAGVKLAPTLYTDALGKPGSAGETYLKMMRYNVEIIVAALR
jgi:ABC-type Zn uptake system ZnuABC Zn-binding protein ZnuA